jgi:hypothetical protein
MYQEQVLKDDVCDKKVVIVNPNAVIDPWTMMIKSLDTLMTHAAMPTSYRSQYLAFWAKLGCIKLFN